MNFKRLCFIIKMFILPFNNSMKISMLMDFYFYIADVKINMHYSIYDYIDNTFYKQGYQSHTDHLHFITVTKLIHFRKNNKFFDEVPMILRKTVILKAITACINYHQHNISLPDYTEFIDKHIGFYGK